MTGETADQVAKNAATAAANNKELEFMAREVAKLTRAVDKYTEHQIRSEEREKRQLEFNDQVIDSINEQSRRISSISDRVRDIENQRNVESGPRDILQKYWWVLLIAGLVLSRHLPKFFSFTSPT